MRNRVQITELKGREIYNRAGRKAIECDVCTIQGQFRAGLSFCKCADDDEGLKAANYTISRLQPILMGKFPDKQSEIDKILKSNDNARSSLEERMAILAISMAVCRAGAMAKQRPLRVHLRALAKMEEPKGEKAKVLPIPVIPLLHTNNTLPVHGFDMIPVGAKNVAEALEIGSKVYKEVEKKLRDKLDKSEVAKNPVTGRMHVSPDVGMTEVKDVLKLLEQVIKDLGYKEKVVLHIDVGANRLYEGDSKMYNIGKLDADVLHEEKNSEQMLSTSEFVEFVLSWTREFPLVRSLSDPLATHDASFKKITQEIGGTCKVGFSWFELQAFQKGCEEKEVNHAFIYPEDTRNNIYTVTDLISVIMSAKKQNTTITFVDLDLTDNDFLTDLAVALNFQVFKAGRLDRYNQLLRIEEELGSKAKVAMLFQSLRRF